MEEAMKKFSQTLMTFSLVGALIGWITFAFTGNMFWMGWGIGNNILQITALIMVYCDNGK